MGGVAREARALIAAVRERSACLRLSTMPIITLIVIDTITSCILSRSMNPLNKR
jgi:hypothetical protein